MVHVCLDSLKAFRNLRFCNNSYKIGNPRVGMSHSLPWRKASGAVWGAVLHSVQAKIFRSDLEKQVNYEAPNSVGGPEFLKAITRKADC